MQDLSFLPKRTRTAAVDLAIRASLADSVAKILMEMTCVGLSFVGNPADWRAKLMAGPAPPRLWACYHELVQAVARLDAEAVSRLASSLLAAQPVQAPKPHTVVTLRADSLLPDDVARYRAVIDNDPEYPLDLLPASHAEMARMVALAKATCMLLAEADVDLADEIGTFGHEIVLASSNGPRGFGGAATVFLWGAVVLNPTLVGNRITLVESLAHETAHALLFGLTLGADLTTNGHDKRYSSPLRADRRPIEGIVHATYVLARMIHALERLRLLSRLDADERAIIEAKITRNRRDFGVGFAIVEEHARFTPDGAAIMQACRAAMDALR